MPCCLPPQDICTCCPPYLQCFPLPSSHTYYPRILPHQLVCSFLYVPDAFSLIHFPSFQIPSLQGIAASLDCYLHWHKQLLASSVASNVLRSGCWIPQLKLLETLYQRLALSRIQTEGSGAGHVYRVTSCGPPTILLGSSTV